jgi:hypothetical protein
MANELVVLDEEYIKSRIHTIRGQQVMLDEDLAELYCVQVKRLNEQVKRNIRRFPERFMFQLLGSEIKNLRSQNATSNYCNNEEVYLGSKELRGGRRYLPYAFTEQGVAMLSGILNSDVAVKVSIQIMDAFVSMRRFIASNVNLFLRLDNVEKKQIEHDKKFDQVFDAIQSKGIKPEKGIFFDGQVFDAYKFVSGIIRSANRSIILIDNYVDESVLMLMCKRNKGVQARIYTRNISDQLKLDLQKCNSQYPPIEIFKFTDSHDRFLIIDNKEVYHIGASLKDLGKRWFAFSRFDKGALEMLQRIEII